MGALKITQRQIIGEFYKTLEIDPGTAWVNDISNYFTSDQASEEYAWLGMSPAMREWVGGRLAKGLREVDQTIINKHYEATMDLLVKDLRRDKTGQVMVRVQEMASRSNGHWASLLSALILTGPSAVCYDGQYFFDTDHDEGDSGTQDNDISVDISTMPAATTGSTTAPSVEEMQWAIVQGIMAIMGFKDDQAEPMNENARQFLVMVPMSLYNAAAQAVLLPFVGSGDSAQSPTGLTALRARNFSIRAEPNARLTWTDSFAVFRTDSRVKALIRQEEKPIELKVKGEGSEYEFDNDAHQYGIDTWRNVGFGMWQNACYVTMT